METAIKDKIREINHHPQLINRIASHAHFTAMKSRVLNQQSIGLIDAAALFKEVASVKLDTHSRESLTVLAGHMAKQDYSHAVKKQAAALIRDQSALIAAWQQNSLMPGGGHRFKASQAALRSWDKLDRGVFLGMTRTLSKMSSVGKSHQQKQGRSRKGRSL